MPLVAEVHDELEEVDLRLFAGTMDQRDVHLPGAPRALGQYFANRGDTALVSTLAKHLQNPCAGQSLFSAQPPVDLREQLIDATRNLFTNRSPARRVLPAHRFAFLEIPANSVPADSHFGGNGANRALFYKNLVSNNMYLAHPEHPSSGDILILGRSKINRYWGSGWVSFRAANGSLFERR